MSEPLWTIAAFAEACGGTLHGTARDVSGISIDSRTCNPGDAFFAIAGDRFDGHDFVGKALESGASVAVVAADKKDRLAFTGGAILLVDDPLKALERLGQAARARSRATIVAITGSVGKTGTKEAIRTVLERFGETHASIASFNNHWGVPLTLARMPASTKFGIFEIGMNHPGEITPLVGFVRPHIAIVTTVEPVHLEFFKSVDEIADAKAEIFSGVEPGGTAIINADNGSADRLVAAAEAAGIGRILRFGESDGADIRLEKIVLLADCSTVSSTVLGESVTYKVGSPGRHIVQNSAAVLAAAAVAGVDLARAALAMANLEAQVGRGMRHQIATGGDPILVIDESYNANPASMRAAISVLANTPIGMRGRRIAVLGDMLELGERGREMHAELAKTIDAAGIDRVFCAGPLTKALWDNLPAEHKGFYGETADDVRDRLLASISPGDAVMIKGSLGSRMGPLVEAILAHFTPRQTAVGGG